MRLAVQATPRSLAVSHCKATPATFLGYARPTSHSFASTSSVAAKAQQHGQSFSQLKEGTAETTEVTFNPYEEGEEQLTTVQKMKIASSDKQDAMARVFFHEESEAAINEQINHEYTMSYVYHAISSYFNRDNVALYGFRDFFREASLEERTHAQQLMDYQATRGGRVKLATLMAPEADYNHEEKGDALNAMEIALAMERLNLQLLYNLHEVAEKHNDSQMADFVEEMMAEQVQGVKDSSDFVARLRRAGKGLGVYEFDKELSARASPPATPPPAA
jgi:ferritin heavy chain